MIVCSLFPVPYSLTNARMKHTGIDAIGHDDDFFARNAAGDIGVAHKLGGNPDFVYAALNRADPMARQRTEFPRLNENQLAACCGRKLRGPAMPNRHGGRGRGLAHAGREGRKTRFAAQGRQGRVVVFQAQVEAFGKGRRIEQRQREFAIHKRQAMLHEKRAVPRNGLPLRIRMAMGMDCRKQRFRTKMQGHGKLLTGRHQALGIRH